MPVVIAEFVLKALPPFTESFMAVTVPYTVDSSLVYTTPEIMRVTGKLQQTPLLPPLFPEVTVMVVLEPSQALQETVVLVMLSVPWWLIVQEVEPVVEFNVALSKVITPLKEKNLWR
jgi:hypothetical protein